MTDNEKEGIILPRENSIESTCKKEEEEKIFSTPEIKIEEMAIDGICGVY